MTISADPLFFMKFGQCDNPLPNPEIQCVSYK